MIRALATGLAHLGAALRERGLRFVLAGLAATASYFLFYFAMLWGQMAPELANAAALFASAVISYLLHYSFTFQADTAHVVSGFRFVVVNGIAIVLGICLHAVVTAAGGSPAVAAVLTALCYPPTTFVLHHFWTFRRGDQSRG